MGAAHHNNVNVSVSSSLPETGESSGNMTDALILTLITLSIKNIRSRDVRLQSSRGAVLQVSDVSADLIHMNGPPSARQIVC